MLKEQQNGSSLMEEAQPLMKDMMSMLHDEIQESSSTSSVTSKLHVQCHSQSINQSVCEFGFLIMMAISLLLPAAIFTFRYDIASQLICQGFGYGWFCMCSLGNVLLCGVWVISRYHIISTLKQAPDMETHANDTVSWVLLGGYILFSMGIVITALIPTTTPGEAVCGYNDHEKSWWYRPIHTIGACLTFIGLLILGTAVTYLLPMKIISKRAKSIIFTFCGMSFICLGLFSVCNRMELTKDTILPAIFEWLGILFTFLYLMTITVHGYAQKQILFNEEAHILVNRSATHPLIQYRAFVRVFD
eukprot:279817_1